MAQQWLRLYTEILEDHRIQTLPDNLFKLLVNSWCIMKRSGKITAEEAAWRLHRHAAQMEILLKRLETAGFLERKEGYWIPHNWDNRQFHSDDAYERVKRFRNAKRNVSETVNETPMITEMKPPQTQTQTTDSKHPPTPLASKRSGNQVSEGFEKFWFVVWRKVNKPGALKAWPAAVAYASKHTSAMSPPQDPVEYLVSKASTEREKSEVPGNEWRAQLHPATWLRGHRWEDEVAPNKPQKSKFETLMDSIT